MITAATHTQRVNRRSSGRDVLGSKIVIHIVVIIVHVVRVLLNLIVALHAVAIDYILLILLLLLGLRARLYPACKVARQLLDEDGRSQTPL